jgi:uncharacterized UBP type Zn finger protein
VHLDQTIAVEPPEAVCPKCEDGEYKWVHVRMCLICGEVGCCDSSPNQHVRKHYEESGHPIVRSLESGEEWGWCYEDKAYLRGSDFSA